MTADANVFVGIAAVAGVFVGFGALIGAVRHGQMHWSQVALVRIVVTNGLLVVVGALLPVMLGLYGIDGHQLWALSSALFLVLSWVQIVRTLRAPESRQLALGQARRRPLSAAFFWVALELPIQLPLLLAVLGVNPALDVAFYFTALAFTLFEAAFILVQLVHAQAADPRA
jgi:hypothetical protein